MDAKGFRGTEKGSVDFSIYHARILSGADLKKNYPLAISSRIGVFCPETHETHSLFYFVSDRVNSDLSSVTLFNVLRRSNPFKVVCSVVCLIFISMMDKMGIRWLNKPTDGNHTMNKEVSTSSSVSILAYSWVKRFQSFKNFTAPRNSVDTVKHSVFNAVENYCAQHGGLLWGTTRYCGHST